MTKTQLNTIIESKSLVQQATEIIPLTHRTKKSISAHDTAPIAGAMSPKERMREGEDFAHAQMLGHYEDLGLLGEGGMGEVRRVKDLTLNRTLAMKIIHRNLLYNQEACDRFIEEAQVGAQLQHPNIVPIYELGRLPDNRLYFTMKEIRGRELSDLIVEFWGDSKDKKSFLSLLQIFYHICEAMAFVHNKGVIHRDLKPDNIMVGEYGEVLIVDWGIAKRLRNTGEEIRAHRSKWPSRRSKPSLSI